MIKIENVTKSFGSTNVLKGIDMEFRKGEIAGVIGENGAGKTTLFKCISNLEKFGGTIQFDEGISKNNIGYLPTDPYFLPLITGREYLQLVCNARDIKGVDFDVNNIFNLPLDRYAESYSTGMKKKLALIGLLLQKNKVFIFDEPFNGVDIHSNIIIEQVITKLKENGKVVILSSHIFSTLNNTCDYLYHIKDGRIAKSVERKDFDAVEQEMKDAASSFNISNATIFD